MEVRNPRKCHWVGIFPWTEHLYSRSKKPTKPGVQGCAILQLWTYGPVWYILYEFIWYKYRIISLSYLSMYTCVYCKSSEDWTLTSNQAKGATSSQLSFVHANWIWCIIIWNTIWNLLFREYHNLIINWLWWLLIGVLQTSFIAFDCWSISIHQPEVSGHFGMIPPIRIIIYGDVSKWHR